MSLLHFDWLYWDGQEVFVVQVKGNSRNYDRLEVWPILTWCHWVYLPLGVLFDLFEHLLINYLRLQI